MLRFARFSQFDGAPIWIVLFIVTQVLFEITWYVLLFDKRQFMRSFGKCCSFRNDIFIFLILNPEKQTEQRFYESFGAKGFRLELKVLKGRRKHLHIHCFLSAFIVVEHSSQSFNWIFNYDFWTWLLCTFTDRISQTHEDDTFWFLQWYQEVIAEMIALYFIHFH